MSKRKKERNKYKKKKKMARVKRGKVNESPTSSSWFPSGNGDRQTGLYQPANTRAVAQT
jgi:hypothetical protein